MSTQAPSKPTQDVAATAREGGEQAVRSTTFERVARAGFAARGAVYVIVGVLTVRLALGVPGTDASQQGAMRALAAQPFGKVLLVLVAIGLAGYAAWRLARAALGHGPEQSDSGLDRLAALGGGIAYAGMAAIAVEILLGGGGGSSSGETQTTTAGVLGWPGGPWLVGAAGAFLVGLGGYQAYVGLSKDFLEDSKTERMSPGVRAAMKWLGLVGHNARAVVYGLVGAFLLVAAATYDPGEAVGVDGALARLAHDSYGPFLLGLVAAGLIAFGAYSLGDVRYRRI